MYYVAIYNPETMEILVTEPYEIESEAQERKRQFDTECMGKGSPWTPYIGEKPFTFEEPEDMKPRLAEMLRAQRDMLLHESDWTETSTRLTLEQKTEWAKYRTKLFDLPDQKGFPDIVTWPTKPEGK